MSEGYVKLLSSIVRSSIWGEPDHVRVVWITMMAIADKHGYVYASVDGLAHEARKTIDETEDALRRFLSPDPRSRTKEHDGRRVVEVDGGWQLLSYERIRAMHGAESERERKREWWNSNRGKKTSSLDATSETSELASATSRLANSRASHGSGSDHDLISSSQISSDLEASAKDLSGNARVSEPLGMRKPVPPPTSDESEQAYISEIKRRCREEPTPDLFARAAGCIRNPYDGQFESPQSWPEVQAMAACFAASYGAVHRHLGQLPRDKGLGALLGILGAGIGHREYMRAVQLSLDDEWFQNLKGPGLTSLSLDVVRRLLAEADERGAA